MRNPWDSGGVPHHFLRTAAGSQPLQDDDLWEDCDDFPGNFDTYAREETTMELWKKMGVFENGVYIQI